MVIFLAYFHRYVLPILSIVLPKLLLGKGYRMLSLGLGTIFFAAYTLIGYLCRWDHIYCSYQNASHEKMTPHRIVWSKVEKSDAYGVPAIFALLGLACILCHFFE